MAQLAIDYAATDDQKTTPGYMQARAVGARAFIVRAIYGRPEQAGHTAPTRDPMWARDKAAILVSGSIRSAYLLLCVPSTTFPGVTPKPEEQAQALIDYVGDDLSPTNAQNFVPIVDVEQESDVLNAEEYFDWVLRAVLVLARHYKAWPCIYSAKHIWAEYTNDHPPGLLQNCPLWIAKPWPWPPRSPVHLDGAAGYEPLTIPAFGDETNWILYQDQGDALGMPGFAQGICDVSRIHTVARGARGTLVEWIQARAGATVDGDYGPKTEAAIKAIQSQHGLDVDGVAGFATNSVLSWLRPAPIPPP
jgi:peptidoglycan hydrolase-like protein with peptidoglycan-binding domain